MRTRKYKIGIDLGGTKIEGVVLNPKLEEVYRVRIPTQPEDGYNKLLDKLADLHNDLHSKIKDQAWTFGIGTPGSVSKETGLIKNSNITCMNGQNFLNDFEGKIKRSFARQNDSNCFAIAEAKLGAARGKKRVFGAILGTGIGGGYVFNGKLISGLQNIMGEWGHSIINSVGDQCYCGKIGCIETYISGKGVEKRYFELTGEKIEMEEIVKRFRTGETHAKMIMSNFFAYFGKAFSNLITILDPDIIVVGGGLSNIDELYVLGILKVRDYIFSDSLKTPIVKTKLGNSAGAVGAALIGI